MPLTSLEVTNPNTDYTLGVLLDPITVRAVDEVDATWLGAIGSCVVTSLSLPLTVVGTLTKPFVAGIATFDDLVPDDGIAPPLVADDFQYVDGTFPDPIYAGIPYEFQVEAIDTTQDNQRVTTYDDPVVTLGVDVDLPSGFVVDSGDLTQPMVDGLAVFPNIIFAEGEVEPPPVTTFTSVFPNTGIIGVAVVGTGTNITVATGATINGIALTGFSVISAASFGGVVPVGAVTGAITLLHPNGNIVGPTFTVTAPVTPPVGPIVIATRNVRFTTTPANQTSNVNFTTALIGEVINRAGVVETGYVTPVTLVMKNGEGAIIGAAVVTPVAGVFTFPANTVGVRLLAASASAVSVGILGIDGATAPINIAVPAAPAQTVIAYQKISAGVYNEPEIVFGVVGPIAGGTIFLEATFDEQNWFAFDATPYVSGAVANSFTAAFNGHADSNGVRAVRVRKSVAGVTHGAITLNVVGL